MGEGDKKFGTCGIEEKVYYKAKGDVAVSSTRKRYAEQEKEESANL